MKRYLGSTSFTRYLLPGFCVIAMGTGIPAGAQVVPMPDTGTPLQRGLGEALRNGSQGGTIGDSLRRGVGETARSAVESPDQTLQRDQQLGLQQQMETQQRSQFGQSDLRYSASGDGNVRLLQDRQGRSYYLDNQGQRVYSQGLAQAIGQGQTQRQSAQGAYQQSQTDYLRGSQSQQPIDRGSSQTGNRQGPTLGVSIEDTANGVQVLKVRSGSAAEKAGLRQGDIIRTINGEQMTSSQDLVRRVNNAQTDELSIQVMRNGQQQQITAMLMSSDSDYRVAKPAMGSGASGNADLSEQLSNLESQLARMRQELETLRQEVNALKGPRGDTELLNNTETTNEGAAQDSDNLFGKTGDIFNAPAGPVADTGANAASDLE